MDVLDTQTRIQESWGSRQERVLSNITHDLRAPLCAIMGYLDLVGLQVDQSDSTKAAQYLTLAREAGQRMNQMVDDILDMFRLENTESPLLIKQIPVASLLHSICKTFSGLAELKKITITCSLRDDAALSTWADPRYLIRVLDNLVANAIKFTPAGGEIRLLARRGPGRTFFEVSDTGRGIPAEDRKRIFKRFEHVHASDQRRGYGMGLAVVKAIVKAHNGAIRVESQTGKGSRFIFWLPDHA